MAFRAFNADRVATLVRALLREDRPNNGWIRVDALAAECEMSRANCYRWLSKLEAAGWPLERDMDDLPPCHRGRSLGIRSLLTGRQRDVDRMARMRRAA